MGNRKRTNIDRASKDPRPTATGGHSALPVTEEPFRLLVEGVVDYAIFMLDPDGRVVSWNPGAERIKGYSAGEIIGQHFSRFYPLEDVQADKPARELAIASSEGKYEEEGWRVRKDGSWFWASVLITARRDPSARLRGFAKVTRDLTERRQAAADLERYSDLASRHGYALEGAPLVQKPFTPEGLARKVREVIDAGRSAEQLR
jgi:PAS domain S-box-containing protein